jgi:hypothetical protein
VSTHPGSLIRGLPWVHLSQVHSSQAQDSQESCGLVVGLEQVVLPVLGESWGGLWSVL